MSKKLESVRIVTFAKDYTIGKEKKRVLFRRGEEAAMHVDVAKGLQAKGAELTIKPFDEKSAYAKAKAEFAEQREKVWK